MQGNVIYLNQLFDMLQDVTRNKEANYKIHNFIIIKFSMHE